jgi:hypothetical protein
MGQARLARYDGRTEDAIAHAARARDHLARLGHPDRARAAMELGLALADAGRVDEARVALAESARTFAENTSREPESYLAQSALALLDGEAGIAAMDAALEAVAADGFERGNAYAEMLGLRARAAEQAGDTAGARAWRAREHDALVALLGTEHPRVKRQETEAGRS